MLIARGTEGDPEAASDFAQRAHGIAKTQGYAALRRDAELILEQLP